MNIELRPGKYVIAVSGGVDSMALLDLLSKQSGLELIVAHFDHGIREDSSNDRELVQNTAEKYGLPFEYAKGRLGSNASEEQARRARYEFLYDIQKRYRAQAIITAHHQDDLVETALINLLRGTGRKGLTALGSSDKIIRPLLAFQKKELIEYAKANNLRWHEDSTNQQTDYLRNYLRLKIIPKLTDSDRQKLLDKLARLKETNKEIDQEIAKLLQLSSDSKNKISKKLLEDLTHSQACEVMAEWLRSNEIREFDRKTIERLVITSKTFKPGQRTDINKQKYLVVEKDTLVISA